MTHKSFPAFLAPIDLQVNKHSRGNAHNENPCIDPARDSCEDMRIENVECRVDNRNPGHEKEHGRCDGDFDRLRWQQRGKVCRGARHDKRDNDKQEPRVDSVQRLAHDKRKDCRDKNGGKRADVAPENMAQ